MLMALIFTAQKDYKGALELVVEALNDFPSNFPLLVLKLKLDVKFGKRHFLHSSLCETLWIFGVLGNLLNKSFY